MRVQNVFFKTSYNKQKTVVQNVSYLSFKSDDAKPVDRLEVENLSQLKSGLAKIDKITKDEYDSLTEQEKFVLRSYVSTLTSFGHSLQKDLHSHSFIANVIKTIMNKQFGEGNYVIIPVGRSLSSVGKLLELQLGKDYVKNIPLSNIGQIYKSAEEGFEKNIETINDFTSSDGFENFRDFLCSIGLDRETIGKSGKNYVIIDYAYRGHSIKAAYDILTCEKLLGNATQNISAVSINDLFELVISNKKNNYDKIKSSILKDLEDRRYKPYAFVGGLHYTNLNDIKTAIDYKLYDKKYLPPNYYEYSLKIHKAFGFMLLDSEFSEDSKSNQYPLNLKNYGKSYVGQKSYLWNWHSKQFSEDVRLDTKEIYKVMASIKEPVEKLEYCCDLLYRISPEKRTLLNNDYKEISKTFTSLKQLAIKILEDYDNLNNEKTIKEYAENFYYQFRPMLLSKLKEIGQKFSAEKKVEILKLMQKRFDQIRNV